MRCWDNHTLPPAATNGRLPLSLRCYSDSASQCLTRLISPLLTSLHRLAVGSRDPNRAGPSESISGHVSARRLATPDEIMRMRPDQLLLLRQGEHPLAVEKIRSYDQREFAGLFDPA